MFTPTYEFECLWKGHPLKIGSVQPRNKGQISSSLKDMSSETIRNRFLGSKREFTSKELEYLTVLDGQNHYAIGIEEAQGQKRGVGLIRLVRSELNPTEGEVAITIIDEYQKLGLGKILMKLMVLAAIERKIERLSFTFLPQNDGIYKLIQSVGIPIPGAKAYDSVQVFLDLTSINQKNVLDDLTRLVPHFKN